MPSTRRVCLTALEVTQNVCFNVPTMEGVKLALARFRHDVLMQHPYVSAAVLLLWSFYPQFPLHLLYFIFYVIPRSIVLGVFTCLGFERQGVRSDSIAASYQARHYGGHTPRNSIFSWSQSYGAVPHEPYSQEPQSHPAVKIFWRILGWLC
ncbi:hypothetical protein BDZ97DRAFT_2079387, partial [Flammula alnicola]